MIIGPTYCDTILPSPSSSFHVCLTRLVYKCILTILLSCLFNPDLLTNASPTFSSHICLTQACQHMHPYHSLLMSVQPRLVNTCIPIIIFSCLFNPGLSTHASPSLSSHVCSTQACQQMHPHHSLLMSVQPRLVNTCIPIIIFSCLFNPGLSTHASPSLSSHVCSTQACQHMHPHHYLLMSVQPRLVNTCIPIVIFSCLFNPGLSTHASPSLSSHVCSTQACQHMHPHHYLLMSVQPRLVNTCIPIVIFSCLFNPGLSTHASPSLSSHVCSTQACQHMHPHHYLLMSVQPRLVNTCIPIVIFSCLFNPGLSTHASPSLSSHVCSTQACQHMHPHRYLLMSVQPRLVNTCIPIVIFSCLFNPGLSTHASPSLSSHVCSTQACQHMHPHHSLLMSVQPRLVNTCIPIVIFSCLFNPGLSTHASPSLSSHVCSTQACQHMHPHHYLLMSVQPRLVNTCIPIIIFSCLFNPGVLTNTYQRI